MSKSGNYDPQEKLEEFQADINVPESDLPNHPELSQFPLSTHDGITRAWSFIHEPGNQERFEQFEIESFKQRVQAAARQKGVDLGNVTP